MKLLSTNQSDYATLQATMMIKLHVTLVLVSLIFIVSVISEKLPELDDKAKHNLEEGGKIIEEAIRKIENAGLGEKSNVDGAKAEITATVQEGKPAEQTTFTKIIGKFVADLFQIPISILKAFSNVISRLTGSGPPVSASASFSSSSSTEKN